jgi:hypothetical protein
MSQSQLHRFNQQAAQKYRFNLGAIGPIVAAVQHHPEVFQLVQLATQLRGNPGMIGQLQSRANATLLAVLVAADGVAEYVAAAERSAGVQPSPLFAAAHQALDAILVQLGPQAGDGATGGNGNPDRPVVPVDPNAPPPPSGPGLGAGGPNPVPDQPPA